MPQFSPTPSTQSPTAWARLRLAITAGADLVGFSAAATYAANTVGHYLKNSVPSLAALAAATGASLTGWAQLGTGAVTRTILAKLRERTTPEDFGAAGDDTTDDTAACQAAIDALPRGGKLQCLGKYKLTAPLIIDKPMTVEHKTPGSFINTTSGGYFRQATAGADVFTLRATTANYAFGQYGIIGVHFRDTKMMGQSSGVFGGSGVGVDTSVNGGDFHIRECTFTNVCSQYLTHPQKLTGIAYLNKFYDCAAYQCTNGTVVEKGAASDVGGQTRFYGCSWAGLDGTCLSFNADTVGGDVSLFGCTLGESKKGLVLNEECIATVMGCMFESLVDSGNGAGIYIPITEANPSSSACRTIIGNKFLTSDADIWIDKQTTAFAGGGFNWPMLIDSNYFGDAIALKITVPAGHVGIDSPAFVFGDANSGPNGTVTSSQISANFLGTDKRKRTISRRYVFGGTYVSGTMLDSLPSGIIITSVRFYLTAHSSGFTSLSVGDQANNNRYISGVDATTQALNTWVNAAIVLPQLVLDGTNNQIRVIGTGGMLGATGVVEVSGYVP